MEEARTIVRNTGLLITSDILSKVISLIFLIYIARLLGDAGFGKYSFIFAFVGIFTLFSDLGIVPLLIREVARDKKKLEFYLYNSLTLRIIATFIALALALLVLLTFERSSEIVISVFLISLAMLFYNLAETCLALFQAYQMMEYPAYVPILERVITVILGISALYMGYGLFGIIIVYFFSYLILFLTAIILTAKKISKIRLKLDFGAMKIMLKDSLPFWLTTIFFTIYFKIDTVMLSFFKGYEPVGWYNAGYAILEALAFIPASIGRAVFPAMSRFYIENKEALRGLFKKAFYYLIILGIPISIGITILAGRIIFLIYGNEFSNSIYALQILIWAVALSFMSSISGNLLNAINQQRIFSYITGGGALINIILNLILIPMFSYIGAAIATVITELFVFLCMLYYIRKHGFGFSVSRLCTKPLIAGIIMAIIMIYFRHINIIVLFLLSVIAYFVMIFLVKGLTNQDFKYLTDIFVSDKKAK